MAWGGASGRRGRYLLIAEQIYEADAGNSKGEEVRVLADLASSRILAADQVPAGDVSGPPQEFDRLLQALDAFRAAYASGVWQALAQGDAALARIEGLVQGQWVPHPPHLAPARPPHARIPPARR